MITLPLRPERVPLVRVLVATSFGNTFTGGVSAGQGPWVVQPMLSSVRAGLELMDGMSRAVLPEIGTCTLRMRYGVVDGKMIGLSSTAVASIQANGTWDPDTNGLNVPSLAGKEIRVQLAEDDGSEPTWRTEWWGRCEYESDSEWPGALLPAGERIYTCLDGLHRTKYWYMTRHAAYVAGTAYNNCVGHPGYNVGLNGATLGNREVTNAAWTGATLASDCDNKFYYHTWQGTGIATVWNDLQAGESALRVSRPEGEPQFSFAGITALLTVGASPWPVAETDAAFDVLARICARERGRGVVFLDWDDDSLNPTGPLVVKLTCNPQSYLSTTYISNPTTGATSTIPGALASATTVAVDLIGDHRVIPEGFTRANRTLASYSGVETVGEKIQVLITASRADGTVSLDDRWSAADVTSFLALGFDERIDEKYRAVFQMYGLPRAWQGLAKDHNNGATIAQHRVDYRCNDLGAVVVPTASPDTSPLLVKILPDTPLLEGYVYNGASPARADAATETGEPDRRPPVIWLRNAADRYDLGEFAGLSLQVKHDGLFAWAPSDQQAGTRLVSDTGEDLGAAYDTDQLGITLALELPHRLRFKSLRSDANAAGLGVRNIKRIEVPDAHLWLASPGAIWDILGSSATADGCTGRRGACGATVNAPGILRDDRTRVAVLHALACSWYLFDHLPCAWSLRCCGLLPSFGIVSDHTNAIEPDDTVAYPTLGQLVTTLAASGETRVVNVPLVGIVYNHQEQTTRFTCDWIDYDVSRA